MPKCDSKPASRPALIEQDWPKALQLDAGRHKLCGCRGSSTWPSCDQSTAACKDKSQELTLSKPRFVWMCQCGRSCSLPFCDGEGHIKLAPAG